MGFLYDHVAEWGLGFKLDNTLTNMTVGVIHVKRWFLSEKTTEKNERKTA